MTFTHPSELPPIGVIDSGVGGFSVLKELNQVFCSTQFHYIADSAWCPYGDKSAEKITERVDKLTAHLMAKGCASVVIACNSATITAVEYLRTVHPIQFTGMEPAIKPAAALTKTNVVGVLATEASLSGERFHKLVNTHGSGIKIITTSCPLFVELVEKGITTGSEVDAAIRLYTEDMLKQNVDVIVLGCTHYPFLKQRIQEIVGEGITIIDTGNAVAERTLSCYKEQFGSLPTSGDNALSIETSSQLAHVTDSFSKLCPELSASFQTLNLL